MAGADYFQFIFVVDNNGLVIHKDIGYLSYKILDNVSVKIIKCLEIDINGVCIYPANCDFDVDGCTIITDFSEIVFTDKYRFGFGGIIYRNKGFYSTQGFDFQSSKEDLFKLLIKLYDSSSMLKEIDFYKSIISDSIDSLKSH